MMHRPMTKLALVAMCASLALLAAGALAAAMALGGGGGSALTGGERSWITTLSPAPDDLALAQISFHGVRPGRLSSHTLRVAASSRFGDDYLAVGAVERTLTPGVARVLVALVNRPSALADPVHVRLRVSADRSLGAPVVMTLTDPFARSASAPRPALCDLRLHGRALAGSQLRILGSHGSPLAGFDASSAIAQAYDAVCGLPFASAFEHAVDPAGESPVSPEPAPAPEPQPPVGRLPGEGCEPRAGYACPLARTGRSRLGAIP